MTDITLAVGDGARRMTYAELAAVRGISLPSARRLVLRHRWPRQVGNDGVVRVTVPLSAFEKGPKPAGSRDTTTHDAMSPATDPMASDRGATTDAPTAEPVATTDPMTVIAIDTLSQAVEMLREDLGIANRRIDKLLTELADAHTAAMITGCEAAALRTQLVLTEQSRRPWWRRWFRG